MVKKEPLRITGKVLLAILLIATALACTATPVAAGEDDTLLVMYVLGTNLESETTTQASENIMDLVNNWDRNSGEVLVFYGAAGIPGWEQGTAVADYEQLIEDAADGRIGIETEEWTETPYILGRLTPNIATKSALTEAVKYTNNYANENGLSDAHWYIIIWDHGSAEDGIGHNDYGLLSNKDIGEALAASDKTFDAIIYDACLMANLEAAYEVKDRASYLLASEDTVPEAGLDYSSIAQALSPYASKAPEDIANTIIDGYLADMGNSKTYSLIDLSKIDAIVSTLDSLGSVLSRCLEDPNSIEAISQWYLDTERFPSDKRPDNATRMDLYDFASQLYFTGNGAIRDTAEKLMSTVDAALPITRMTTGDPTKTNGLSLSGSIVFMPQYIDQTVTLSNGDWAQFLKEFAAIRMENRDTEYSYSASSSYEIGDEITRSASDKGSNSKVSSPGTLTITGDNGKSIVFVDYLYRADGKYYILFQEVAEAGTKEVEGNEFWRVLPTGEYTTGEDWDGTAFILEHAESSVPVTMLHTNEYDDNGDTITEFTIDGILTRTVDGVEVSLPSYLTAVINGDTVLDLYVISGSTDDSYARRSNAWGTEDIQEGDRFTPLLDYMTEDSDEIYSEQSTETFVFSDNPLADLRKVELDLDNCFWEYEITTYLKDDDAEPTLLSPADFVNGTVTVPANPTASAQSPAPFMALATGLAAAAVFSRRFS